MLEYDRIEVSEGIDVNKTDGLRDCIICHWYCINIYSRFQSEVCDNCHDLMQNAMSFKDIGIVSVKGNDLTLLEDVDIEKKMKPYIY